MNKIIMLILVLMMITLVGCVGEVSDQLKESCKTECAKYDYQYMKVDVITSRSTNNYECYCLDEDNKPKSIGIIDNEFDFMRWIITS